MQQHPLCQTATLPQNAQRHIRNRHSGNNESVPGDNPGTLIAEPLSKCGPTLARAYEYCWDVLRKIPAQTERMCLEFATPLPTARYDDKENGVKESVIETFWFHGRKSWFVSSSEHCSDLFCHRLSRPPIIHCLRFKPRCFCDADFLARKLQSTPSDSFPGCTVFKTGGFFWFAGSFPYHPKNTVGPV